MMATLAQSGWKRFWERGGWWKAVIAVAVYYALYQVVGLPLAPLLEGLPEDAEALQVAVGYAAPILLGCIILVIFAASVGWLRELFGPQPIRGRGWMWIAVVIVLLFNVLRFAAIDYTAAGLDVVAAWLLAGLFIGFAEEVLTRGIAVNLLRKGGHRELTVALISSALFAGMHAGNLLTGLPLLATSLQLLYTFTFGICMYLTLRLTGNLIWPILVHASTDPAIFLQTLHPADTPLGPIAGLGNIAVILTGIALVFFIRGHANLNPTGPLRTAPTAG